MKKAFLHALCSALVIPGLGQLMNRDFKKGAALLFSMLVLFVSLVLVFFHRVSEAAKQVPPASKDFVKDVVSKAIGSDAITLWVLIVLLVVVWLYSVVDAFLSGLREKGPFMDGN